MPSERMAAANGMVKRRALIAILPPTFWQRIAQNVFAFVVAPLPLRFHPRLDDREQFRKIHRGAPWIVGRYMSLAHPLLARVVGRGVPRPLCTSIKWPIPKIDHPSRRLLLR